MTSFPAQKVYRAKTVTTVGFNNESYLDLGAFRLSCEGWNDFFWLHVSPKKAQNLKQPAFRLISISGNHVDKKNSELKNKVLHNEF